MIKHIVMWKLKEGQDKMNVANEIKIRLEALKNSIEEIVTIEVGLNLLAEQAYDIALYSEFKTLNDLSIYQSHPEHLKVVGFIKSVVSERVVVDYDI